MKNSIIIGAVILIVYSILLVYGPKPTIVKMQSQWQNNQYVVGKYLRDSKKGPTQNDVVIVGSSLARRLDFDEESKRVYNLALDGDSAMTGLSVIASSGASPRLVFIEINVPEYASNQELIDKVSGFFQQLSPAFYVENTPINLAYSFLYSYKLKLNKEKPQKKAIEAVRQNALSVQIKRYESLIPPDILRERIIKLKRLVTLIEERGTKIVFFEMPISPDLENTSRAIQIRNIFKSSFPKHKLINYEELAKGHTIKTLDGIHLEDEEARFVEGNIRVNF